MPQESQSHHADPRKSSLKPSLLSNEEISCAPAHYGFFGKKLVSPKTQKISKASQFWDQQKDDQRTEHNDDRYINEYKRLYEMQIYDPAVMSKKPDSAPNTPKFRFNLSLLSSRKR